MLPVCSWDDVAYGIYETDGRIAIASEYGRDVYANAVEYIFQIKRHVKKHSECVLAYMSCPYSKALDMLSAVSYIPYATSSHEQTGDIITFS